MFTIRSGLLVVILMSMACDADVVAPPAEAPLIRTMRATAVDGLKLTLMTVPPDSGSAVGQLPDGRIVIPGSEMLHICSTTEQFCDELESHNLDWLGEAPLGRPTAVLVTEGAYFVSSELGLAAIDAETYQVEVLYRFDGMRNVTTVLLLVDRISGDPYILLTGWAYDPQIEDLPSEIFAADNEDVASLFYGSEILAVPLGGGEVLTIGFEVSFTAVSINEFVAAVGDDFGEDLTCQILGGELICQSYEGFATMGLQSVPESPWARESDESVWLAAGFNTFSVTRTAEDGHTSVMNRSPTNLSPSLQRLWCIGGSGRRLSAIRSSPAPEAHPRRWI